MNATEKPLGLSGKLARQFQSNPLTPILALTALLLGLFAVWVTPREEEPQIDVTMANVFVPFPGASVDDVENLVSMPLEKLLSALEGVKHVYSISQPGNAVVTVEFDVGVPRQDALVRLYNQVYAHADFQPSALGIGTPLVRPMGIDDVPILGLTLWSDDPAQTSESLSDIAQRMETEVKRVRGTREVFSIGADPRALVVELDVAKLATFDLSVDEIQHALMTSNQVLQAGERIDAQGSRTLTVGQFLMGRKDFENLVIAQRSGKTAYLKDVATVLDRADLPTQYVWFGAPAAQAGPRSGIAKAITVVVGKQPGSNASNIAQAVQSRLQTWRRLQLPEGVHLDVTRDYGASANDKAFKLIQKLVFATMAVVLLVLTALGRREAVVVGSAVIITLALTLFASWAMGFTINRVSLFALIFSIGILVDDAIVVVENIHRHSLLHGGRMRDFLPAAVDEVGSPTILATFTVIAALLPMAFVTGLMGPYMRPIPINASVGMLISLIIALTVTPWLALKLLNRHAPTDDHKKPVATSKLPARLHKLFSRLLLPFLRDPKATRRRRQLFVGIVAAVAIAVGMVAVQWVVLKMLPFDNKSELQVMVDLPEGSTLEQTNATLLALTEALQPIPEILSYQGYAGTSAPISFNGLVRQYFLRQMPHLGDLQINLVDKHDRSRSSHEIARTLRPMLTEIGRAHQAIIKIVEVPPGPPVAAALVAEVYGPDDASREETANTLRALFAQTEGVVDIDTSLAAAASRETLVVDRVRAASVGVTQAQIAQVVRTAVSGSDVGYLRDASASIAQPIRIRLSAADQASRAQILSLRVRSGKGELIPLSELAQFIEQPWSAARHRKDMLPVEYVTADAAGSLDSPLYALFSMTGSLRDGKIEQTFISPPEHDLFAAIKWDGEWQITYETFRDMGAAYAVGLLLIYLLLVAQFHSYRLPLIVMAPIPLTVIGVMPGHTLLGAQFTATSMIGMIALAGIIVRNSILLVDFIRQAEAAGQATVDAVIDACAVRAQPIVLTALAAMAGALFILDDPIFNGLAVSLIFGILISTLLTLVVIPVLYASFQGEPSATARSTANN